MLRVGHGTGEELSTSVLGAFSRRRNFSQPRVSAATKGFYGDGLILHLTVGAQLPLFLTSATRASLYLCFSREKKPPT